MHQLGLTRPRVLVLHPDPARRREIAARLEVAGVSVAADSLSATDPLRVADNYDYSVILLPLPLDDSSTPATDPLAKENATGVLDEAGDPVAVSSTAPSTDPSKDSKDSQETSDGQTPAAASDADTTDNTTLWVTLGAAAAVLVIGGGAFAVYRSRRGA